MYEILSIMVGELDGWCFNTAGAQFTWQIVMYYERVFFVFGIILKVGNMEHSSYTTIDVVQYNSDKYNVLV